MTGVILMGCIALVQQLAALITKQAVSQIVQQVVGQLLGKNTRQFGQQAVAELCCGVSALGDGVKV